MAATFPTHFIEIRSWIIKIIHEKFVLTWLDVLRDSRKGENSQGTHITILEVKKVLDLMCEQGFLEVLIYDSLGGEPTVWARYLKPLSKVRKKF